MSTPRHLNGVNASLPLEKGNTYHIILNLDASTFEPQLEFGFWDGNRKLYEYYVHKSDTVITYTFKPQETKTYRINLRMRQAGYEGEAQTFYVKSAAIHQYQVKVSQETKGGSSHIYDFHARQYAPALGRLWSVDPLADHPNQVDKSAYAAFWNNPIRYDDPDGMCPECKENVIDPTDGQSYTSTGGADYTFGNGEWTRQGGMLNEVTVTAQKPSLLEKGYYRGQAAAQDAWNSPMARAYFPDKISLSFSSSVTAFAGTNTDFSLNWITRGHDAQFTPYAVLTVGGQGGPQVSGDALINFSAGYYATSDMRSLQRGQARDGLLGWSTYGSADAGLGLGGSITGSVGFQDSRLVSRPTWISGGVGIGASIGGGATGGVSYSWPIVPSQFKR